MLHCPCLGYNLTMRAWVAGATGYTGREVVRLLCEQGHEVSAHVRPATLANSDWKSRFEKMGAHVVVVDWELNFLANALRQAQPSIVFSLVGTTRSRAYKERLTAREAYRRVDRDLTLMLINAVKLANLSPRFVYLSAIGANPDSRNTYLRVRGEVEEAIKTSALTYTIARPSFITGPNRDEFRPLERTGALMSDAILDVFAVIGAGGLRERFRSMSNTEVAKALVFASTEARYANTVLEAQDLSSLA